MEEEKKLKNFFDEKNKEEIKENDENDEKSEDAKSNAEDLIRKKEEEKEDINSNDDFEKDFDMDDNEDGKFLFLILEFDEEFKNYILVDPAFVGEIYEGYEVIDNYFN